MMHGSVSTMRVHGDYIRYAVVFPLLQGKAGGLDIDEKRGVSDRNGLS